MAESQDRYVALLRGINVGGNNLIPMPALKASFETLGFGGVSTYIQSGNVLFTAKRSDPAKLEVRIEKVLSAEFDYLAKVVLRSREQMNAVVLSAPRGFGKQPAKYRYDVLFLKDPLEVREAVETIRTREGVDAMTGGDGVIYFSRLIARATQSYLSKVVMMPIYKRMTIRNWNTTTKLARLLEG